MLCQGLHVAYLYDTMLYSRMSSSLDIPDGSSRNTACNEELLQPTMLEQLTLYFPCLAAVLLHRCTAGIPISLSLVYLEVASRVGLKMAGVNLPAHFMIRPQVRYRAEA